MNDRGQRFFRPEAILVLCITLILGLAERTWWYPPLVVLGLAIAWRRKAKGRPAPLRPRQGAGLILAAFVLMLAEYVWLNPVPLLVLSHFMVLVCAVKMMHERTLRDDAQVLVLLIFLLIISGVTSGDFLFLIVLLIYLTVGIRVMIRFGLACEEARCAVGHRSQTEGDNRHAEDNDRRDGFSGILTGFLVCGFVCGGLLFVLCPRFGAGMLGRVEARHSARAVTGFSANMTLTGGGRVSESSQPVMRVQFEQNGEVLGKVDDRWLYFRGSVLDSYQQRSTDGSAVPHWEWEERDNAAFYKSTIDLDSDRTGLTPLLGDRVMEQLSYGMVQHYWLEPGRDNYLFSCYPALAIQSADIKKLRGGMITGILQMFEDRRRVIRYQVLSADPLLERTQEVLNSVYGRIPEYLYHAVPPKVPRAQEIIALARRVGGDFSDLQDSQSRRQFAERIRDYLRSDQFTYSLQEPDVAAGDEPIGEFLLDSRRGHCEYFASAMALMCQLAGVPARVVNGYQGGEYNPLGNFYLVREQNAHSWVEVYIPGQGWLRYDPTPSAGHRRADRGRWLAGVRDCYDYIQFCWANRVMSYDSPTREKLLERFKVWLLRPTHDEKTLIGAVAAFVGELFGGELRMTAHERAIYWIFTLLVLCIAFMTGYGLVLIGRWIWRRTARWYRLRHGPRLAPQADFYYQFCDLLSELGIERQAGQTPAEFAAELGQHYAELADAEEVVRAYYQIAYGGRPLDEQRHSAVQAILQRVRQLSSIKVETTTAR